MLRLVVALCLGGLPAAALADQLPLKPTRQLEREVSAGTWMSLALSPDGRTVVFDLLGEIYVMPASGGRAQRLLGGMAFEAQPTFSPDGR
jgi:Tol biopolymer transport system component